jgi:hypothetical protein
MALHQQVKNPTSPHFASWFKTSVRVPTYCRVKPIGIDGKLNQTKSALLVPLTYSDKGKEALVENNRFVDNDAGIRR